MRGKPAFDDLRKDYLETAQKHGEAFRTGRHKEANRAYARMKRIFGKLRSDTELAQELLQGFLQNPDPSVRTWAATHALALDLLRDDAISVLQALAQDHTIGILRTQAEMGLQVWREKGTFTF